MEAAKKFFVINIVFLLIQCVTYMHAQCYVREYKLLPGGINIYILNGVQPVFKTVKLKDISKCGQKCADEKFCNVWRFGLGNCQIFHAMKDKVTAKISTNTTTKTYYETGEDDQWMKIYSMKSGSGLNGVFNTFMPAYCTNGNCPGYFSSFFFEIWTSLPIMKVKLSLFKNDTEVLRVIFDGQGTNSLNWFTMSRVLDSPWRDVYKGATSAHFGINYYYEIPLAAVKSFGSCQISGWIALIGSPSGCYLLSYVYPVIIYSDKEHATTGYRTADALAIYVSF